MNRKVTAIVCLILLSGFLGSAQAKVSSEEAAKLKGELTPVGAERAGNADGTIPEWTGGIQNPPAHKNGDWLADPFAAEKPLFTITAENYKQYADKLSRSQMLMFENKIPNWKMNVYQTHRTVKLPDWVEENTYNNALNAELVDNGNGVDGACGGFPFPIPKSGSEVIQNHLMHFWGVAYKVSNMGLEGYKNSPGVETYCEEATWLVPYYLNGQEGKTCGDSLFNYSNVYTKPARRKGEMLIVNDYLNARKRPREAWQYIPGQRRVRRAPTFGFDTPDMPISTVDDAYQYNGSPERYNWKLIGKQEMYIPYNGYTFEHAYGQGTFTIKDMTPGYPESNPFRWELHRVWVVEGALKEGERHIYAKRVFYIDEDSWTIAIEERIDAKDNLWRSSFGNIYFDYGGGKWTQARPILNRDFQSGEYMVWMISATPSVEIDPPSPEYYTPQGLRKRAKR